MAIPPEMEQQSFSPSSFVSSMVPYVYNIISKHFVRNPLRESLLSSSDASINRLIQNLGLPLDAGKFMSALGDPSRSGKAVYFLCICDLVNSSSVDIATSISTLKPGAVVMVSDPRSLADFLRQRKFIPESVSSSSLDATVPPSTAEPTRMKVDLPPPVPCTVADVLADSFTNGRRLSDYNSIAAEKLTEAIFGVTAMECFDTFVQASTKCSGEPYFLVAPSPAADTESEPAENASKAQSAFLHNVSRIFSQSSVKEENSPSEFPDCAGHLIPCFVNALGTFLDGTPSAAAIAISRSVEGGEAVDEEQLKRVLPFRSALESVREIDQKRVRDTMAVTPVSLSCPVMGEAELSEMSGDDRHYLQMVHSLKKLMADADPASPVLVLLNSHHLSAIVRHWQTGVTPQVAAACTDGLLFKALDLISGTATSNAAGALLGLIKEEGSLSKPSRESVVLEAGALLAALAAIFGLKNFYASSALKMAGLKLPFLFKSPLGLLYKYKLSLTGMKVALPSAKVATVAAAAPPKMVAAAAVGGPKAAVAAAGVGGSKTAAVTAATAGVGGQKATAVTVSAAASKQSAIGSHQGILLQNIARLVDKFANRTLRRAVYVAMKSEDHGRLRLASVRQTAAAGLAICVAGWYVWHAQQVEMTAREAPNFTLSAKLGRGLHNLRKARSALDGL